MNFTFHYNEEFYCSSQKALYIHQPQTVESAIYRFRLYTSTVRMCVYCTLLYVLTEYVGPADLLDWRVIVVEQFEGQSSTHFRPTAERGWVGCIYMLQCPDRTA